MWKLFFLFFWSVVGLCHSKIPVELWRNMLTVLYCVENVFFWFNLTSVYSRLILTGHSYSEGYLHVEFYSFSYTTSNKLSLNLLAISVKAWNCFKIDLLNPFSTLNVILLLCTIKSIWCFFYISFHLLPGTDRTVMWINLPGALHGHRILLRELSWDLFWMHPTYWIKPQLLDLVCQWASMYVALLLSYFS